MKENYDALYKEYMAISNFPFINPDYIVEIIIKLKISSKKIILSNFCFF